MLMAAHFSPGTPHRISLKFSCGSGLHSVISICAQRLYIFPRHLTDFLTQSDGERNGNPIQLMLEVRGVLIFPRKRLLSE